MLIIPAGLPLARQYVRPVFRAADVYRPVTKWSALAHIGAGTARPDAPRLSRHAQRQGRPGAGRNSGRGVRGRVQGRARLHAGAGAAHRRPIRTRSRRPRRCCWRRRTRCCWAGQGVHYAEAGDRLAALAELMPAPVVTTNPGKSAIPESHPLSLGASTRSRPKMFTDFMAKADLVLAVGIEPHPDAVRAGRAAGQDHHPFHQRRRRHQQGVPRRPCRGRRRRAGARRADRGGRPAEGRRAAAMRSPRSRRRSPRPRRPGSRNGRSTSTPTRRRSTSIASSAT